MKSYILRARPNVQQCFKHVLAEPTSTYDAVIIGGGMNVRFAARDYIFYVSSCVALFIEARRKCWMYTDIEWSMKGTAYKVKFAGSQILPIIVNCERFVQLSSFIYIVHPVIFMTSGTSVIIYIKLQCLKQISITQYQTHQLTHIIAPM